MMPSISLKKLPLSSFNIIQMIGQRADLKGINAYLVGGCVRDLILGKKNFDIDIVVEGDTVELAKEFCQKLRASLTIYPKFKTATLCFPDGLRVDFASARKEKYSTPGALPETEDGTIRDDLFRRDFTINALAVSLNQKNWGVVIDEGGGRSDLNKKIIRIFHPRSFIDDPTRMLRAIRFEQRLEFHCDSLTEQLLKQAIERKLWSTVSPSRYFDEFKKTFDEPRCIRVLERLADFKGLNFIHPDFHRSNINLDLLAQIQKKMDWFHLCISPPVVLEAWVIFLMGLFDPLTVEMIIKITQNFQIAKRYQRKIIASKTQQRVFVLLSNVGLKPSQVYKILSMLSSEEILFLLSKNSNAQIDKYVKSFFELYRHISIETRGQDLMRLGINDGPKMRYILESLLHQKIDGEIKTAQDEQRYLKEISLIKGGIDGTHKSG
jgi:tRNA nucleotidyltransferase (CCA-adding enzyme)